MKQRCLGGSSPCFLVAVLIGFLCCGKGSFGRARALPDDPSSIGTGADTVRSGELA